MPVVDSNVLVIMVSGDPRRQIVLRQITQWLDEDKELHAPLLAHYEIASALTRWVIANKFPLDKIEEAVEGILVVPVHYHPITNIPRTSGDSQDTPTPECLRCRLPSTCRVVGLRAVDPRWPTLQERNNLWI